MSKIYWFTVISAIISTQQFGVLGIDLSRLYGHEGAMQKRSGKS